MATRLSLIPFRCRTLLPPALRLIFSNMTSVRDRHHLLAQSPAQSPTTRMGYPNFKSLLSQSPAQPPQIDLPDESVQFDAEGWPIFVTHKKKSAADDDVPIVTPKPRQRKQRAMQARSSAKSIPIATSSTHPISTATPALSTKPAGSPKHDAPILRVRTAKDK